MLKLHGTPISNFYCIVKQVMLEKGIAFEEVHVMANQEPAFLAISPMGKIPALETEYGYLTETNVILEYLEEVQPSPALYPQNVFARAQVKQLIKMVEDTIIVVEDGLNKLNENDLEKEYPLLVFKEKASTGFFLIHLAVHLDYHLGQINYHRRLLDI